MLPEKSTDKPGVEERLLASIDLIDAAQACALLRIETDDPEGAIQAMARDDALITLIQNGEIRLPLFQFDTELGRVFDVVGAILKLRPARVSTLMLCLLLADPCACGFRLRARRPVREGGRGNPRRIPAIYRAGSTWVGSGPIDSRPLP